MLSENGHGRTLLESVNHEQFMKGQISKVASKINYSDWDIEHKEFYRFIVWSVTKYKAFMQGISEGFYDNPKQFEN